MCGELWWSPVACLCSCSPLRWWGSNKTQRGGLQIKNIWSIFISWFFSEHHCMMPRYVWFIVKPLSESRKECGQAAEWGPGWSKSRQDTSPAWVSFESLTHVTSLSSTKIIGHLGLSHTAPAWVQPQSLTIQLSSCQPGQLISLHLAAKLMFLQSRAGVQEATGQRQENRQEHHPLKRWKDGPYGRDEWYLPDRFAPVKYCLRTDKDQLLSFHLPSHQL